MGNARPGYAIVRVDEYDTAAPLEDRVVVKRVVPDESLAIDEVRRPNEINADKRCHYFWQYTRVDVSDSET